MNEPSKARTCPQCGAAIPENAPRGLCPKCLLEGAAATTATCTDTGQRPEPPSLEALKAAFPHLEVLEFIGQGGMGFVFKARQSKLERFVALKILPESLSRDAAFAERFAREGRLLARLNHPNIVSVYDFGQANAFFYLLMEFVDGVNLRQAMRASRFTPEQALAIVPSICAALQYAHDEGVLHRDIKPENILLDTKGRVKIADFGIAKLLGEAQANAGLTTSGAALGTPHYMAPEQIEKPSDVDHRADIYSLGVVFYELLTGELPLGRFAPPSAKTPVNAQVDEVVMRALEKERERRQQSAGEMKTQVETAAASPSRLGERPMEQTPQLSQMNPWPKRLFWLIVALVVVPVLMIVTGLQLLWPAYRSLQSPSGSSTPAAALPEKTIVLTGATNHLIDALDDVRTVGVRTDSLLLPGESLIALVKHPDGQMAVAQTSFFIQRKENASDVRTSSLFSWFFRSSFGNHEAESAIAQLLQSKTERPIVLIPGKPIELFSVTNQFGAAMTGYLEFRRSVPQRFARSTGSVRNVRASVNVLGYTKNIPSLTFSANVPPGYALQASSNVGQAHTAIRGSEYRSTWFQPPQSTFRNNLPARMQQERSSLEAQFQELIDQNPIQVVLGKPRLVFSVTNSTGGLFEGFLELVGPPSTADP